MTVRGIAVLWPDEKNYARFREVSSGIRAETLEAYRAAIGKDLEAKERAGIKIARVPFDIDELIAFAASRGFDGITSEIRATFAAMVAMRRDTAARS